MNNARTAALSALLLVGIAGWTACKPTPFYAEEGAILLASSDRTILKTNGDRAAITVLGITPDGQPLHDHTTVLFTATLGSIPQAAEIMGGRAVVEYVSGSASGMARITARSGSVEAEPLEIAIGSGALATLTISASPAQLGVAGGRTWIAVYAVDASSNFLADIPVILTASAGELEKGSAVRWTDRQGMVGEYLQTSETAVVRADSGKISAEVTVLVRTNALPTASFSLSPASARIGDTVVFDAGASGDADGRIVSWSWDFGDGGAGSGEMATHAYTRAGTFLVKLTVEDNDGGRDTAMRSVTVN